MITSTANRQVKNLIQLSKKAKERQAGKVFLAEGLRIFEEIPKSRLQGVYVSESFLQKKEHAKALEGIDYETVSDPVFAHMSDTKTPQGILCVVRQPEYKLEELLQKEQAYQPSFVHEKAHLFVSEEQERRSVSHGKVHLPVLQERAHLLVLEGIQDPGNLGTMFRTGEGAGVSGIILGGCADLFAPKTVRSTMGSICRVPFYISQNLPETLDVVKKHGVALYAAHLKGEKYYDTFDYRRDVAFLIGSEANGLTKDTAAMADVYVKIPMGGKLESLNAAMAAGIFMYEVNRQRRQ